MKVLYDEVNTINQSIFMFIQIDVVMDVPKHFFKKTFFWSFAASSWGEILFFFVIVPTPISYLYCFFFCRVSLSLSSYAFHNDVILLQSSWSTGNLAIFLNWFLIWCFQIILYFRITKTFLFLVDLFFNWWYYSSCCN